MGANKETIKKQNDKVRKNWYGYIVRESSVILTNLRLDLETKLAYAKRKRDGWIREYHAAQDRLIRTREYLREHNAYKQVEEQEAKVRTLDLWLERIWVLTDYLQGRARLALDDALVRILDFEKESKINDRECLVLLVMMLFAHDRYTEEEATKTT